MSSVLWIQALESQPPSEVTHLEIEMDQSLFACLHLARAWFAASPEPRLEKQSFRAELTLLDQIGGMGVASGFRSERPPNLEPSFEVVREAYLHVSRESAWFEVRTMRGAVFDTRATPFEPSPTLEQSDAAISSEERVTQVTLALEIRILHEGEFGEAALEELLHNLDFALEQQRGSASLAPESVDGVTENFLFHLLDVRSAFAAPPAAPQEVIA